MKTREAIEDASDIADDPAPLLEELHALAPAARRRGDDRLRYAILIDQPRLDDWHRACIERLRTVKGVHCALVIAADLDPSVELALPASATIAHGRTANDGAARLLDARSEAVLAAAAPDFLLLFTPDAIGGDVIAGLRYGAWRFRFDDTADAASAAFWGMHGDKLTIDAQLERLHPDQRRSVPLRRGTFAIHVHSTSETAQTIDRIATQWPSQVCIDLINGVGLYVDGDAAPSRGMIRRPITAGAALRVRAQSIARGAEAISENLFRSYRWNIGVARSTPLEIATCGRLPETEWMPHRDDTYLADPFPIQVNGRRYVACEQFDYNTRHGVISIAEVDGRGRCSAPAPAIVRPYHMSYPFIIQEGGRIYCVPESFEARKVILYVADPFPTVWREEAVLVDDFPGVDNTLVQHEGRWWMFSTNQDESACGSLWIFHAPHLHGPWEPHQNNPVKMDISSSRPAGPFFREGSALYRPTQDCSDRYGLRVVVLRVTVLSTKEFREEVTAVIEPDQTGPYPRGFHTIGGWSDWSVVDGSRYSYSSAAMRSAARYYASRLSERLGSLVGRRRWRASEAHEPLPRLRT